MLNCEHIHIFMYGILKTYRFKRPRKKKIGLTLDIQSSLPVYQHIHLDIWTIWLKYRTSIINYCTRQFDNAFIISFTGAEGLNILVGNVKPMNLP